MQWAEAKQWLETLGVVCSFSEDTWQRMNEQTRQVFVADVRQASLQNVLTNTCNAEKIKESRVET